MVLLIQVPRGFSPRIGCYRRVNNSLRRLARMRRTMMHDLMYVRVSTSDRGLFV